MVTGMVENLGRETGDGRRSFPAPESLAAMPLQFFVDEVRAGYRAPYLKELADRVASGNLNVEQWLTSELPTAELVKVSANAFLATAAVLAPIEGIAQASANARPTIVTNPQYRVLRMSSSPPGREKANLSGTRERSKGRGGRAAPVPCGAVATDWRSAFDLGDGAEPVQVVEEERQGVFRRLRQGLSGPGGRPPGRPAAPATSGAAPRCARAGSRYAPGHPQVGGAL